MSTVDDENEIWGHGYDIGKQDGIELERERLKELLQLAVTTIERLAEQQAMPDQFYEVPLNKIKQSIVG